MTDVRRSRAPAAPIRPLPLPCCRAAELPQLIPTCLFTTHHSHTDPHNTETKLATMKVLMLAGDAIEDYEL